MPEYSPLMFVAPDDFPICASLRAADASFERQQALRREVMSEGAVASFATREQLAGAVTKALFVRHEDRRSVDQPATQQLAEICEATPETEPGRHPPENTAAPDSARNSPESGRPDRASAVRS